MRSARRGTRTIAGRWSAAPGPRGLALPFRAHAREEVAAGARLLIERLLAAIAVVAHTRSAHERARTALAGRQAREQATRALDATVADRPARALTPALRDGLA